MQVDVVKGLETFAASQREAFEKDPVTAAQTYFPEDQKPAPLPEFDPLNPGEYTAALERRALEMKGLVDAGFTSRFTLLSDAEIKQAGAVFSKDSPADVRRLPPVRLSRLSVKMRRPISRTSAQPIRS